MKRLVKSAGLLCLLGIATTVRATDPAWWTNSETRIIDPNADHSTSANYAPANIGQLKSIAAAAKIHLDENLAGGAGTNIDNLINGFSTDPSVNYAPANIGQLKAVAQPFYDRLIAAGYDTKQNLINHGYTNTWSSAYPWDTNNPVPTSANYAPVNMGQLKSVFSFDLSNFNIANIDNNNNGLPDWWEQAYFPGVSIALNQLVPGSSGLTYQDLYNWEQQQDQSSTVGDGIPDSWKEAHGIDTNDPNAANEDPDNDGFVNADEYDADTDPQNPDTDNDGILDGQDLYPKIPNLSTPWLNVDVPSLDAMVASGVWDNSKVDYTRIQLQWQNSQNNPSGYIVERRINSAVWETLATITSTRYDDQGLLANQRYEYRITAFRDTGGQRIYSDSAVAYYDVPENLAIDSQTSQYTGSKISGYSEFIPSNPPKYYQVRDESETYSNSTSGSASGLTETETWNWTITSHDERDVSAGTWLESYSYKNFYTDHQSWSDGYSDGTYTDQTTYNWLTQERVKGKPFRSNTGSTSEEIDTNNSSWTKTDGSQSSSSNLTIAGDYANSEAFTTASGDAPAWNSDGYDDIANVDYSGQSNYSSADNEYVNGTLKSQKRTSIGTTEASDGTWSGTRTDDGVSSSMGGPAWSGGGAGDPWFVGAVAVSPTEMDASNPNGTGSISGSITLSDEYTTQDLISDTISNLPDYNGKWDSAFMSALAVRSLSKDEATFTVSKVKYRITANPSAPFTLKWCEVFIPEDDPNTDQDESLNVKIVAERSWTLGAGNNSSEYEITDALTEERNGIYQIIMQPVNISVSDIGDAGKNIAGDESNPGKVVLIDDGDTDNDGIPDYADGYNLFPAITQSASSAGSSFTHIAVDLTTFDPDHAKIRFTYSASDPMQVTSTATNPFTLPSNGSLRIWLKDGSDQRNGLPIAAGGDFIQPGVDYTLSQLGLTGPTTVLSCYVEVVKPSVVVADMPIKVEVDPTGSMGYVWSDELRFTGDKLSWFVTDYQGGKTMEVESFAPCTVTDLVHYESTYGLSRSFYSKYYAVISDPRTSLRNITINNHPVPLTLTDGQYKSSNFVPIIPGSTIDIDDKSAIFVPVIAGQFSTFQYNASGTVDNLSQVRRSYREANEISAACEQAGKVNLPTENTAQLRGNGVYNRMKAILLAQASKTILAGVRVNDLTGEVVSIDRNLTPTTTPAINDTTDIDFLILKEGESLKVGDIWDPNKIARIYEVKITSTGRLDKDQRDRLLALVNKKEDLMVTWGKYSWVGEGDDVKLLFSARNYIFRGLAIFGAATAIMQTLQASDDLESVEDNSIKYRNDLQRGEAEAAMLDLTTLGSQMDQFTDEIAALDPSGISAGLIKGVNHKQLEDNLNQLIHDNL
jgi:hypothetical protein